MVALHMHTSPTRAHWWHVASSLARGNTSSDRDPQAGCLVLTVILQDDVDFLQGTNAYVAVQEIKSTLKKEYKIAMKQLPESFRASYTRPLYLWAYAIFTSRSFRPSLVLPEAESLKLPCEIDDFSVLLPLYDLGNHSPVAKTSWTADHSSQLVSLRCGESYEAGKQVFNVCGARVFADCKRGPAQCRALTWTIELWHEDKCRTPFGLWIYAP